MVKRKLPLLSCKLEADIEKHTASCSQAHKRLRPWSVDIEKYSATAAKVTKEIASPLFSLPLMADIGKYTATAAKLTKEIAGHEEGSCRRCASVTDVELQERWQLGWDPWCVERIEKVEAKINAASKYYTQKVTAAALCVEVAEEERKKAVQTAVAARAESAEKADLNAQLLVALKKVNIALEEALNDKAVQTSDLQRKLQDIALANHDLQDEIRRLSQEAGTAREQVSCLTNAIKVMASEQAPRVAHADSCAAAATPAQVTNGDLAHCTSDTGICTVPGRGHREPASAQDEQQVEACLPQIEELADQAMSMTEYYKLRGDERSLLTLARRQISMRSWTLH